MNGRNPIEQIEYMRNLLAFLLVTAFIAGGGALMRIAIPEQNKELVSYMVGQLSGMALMALAFYFTDKVGQAAIDAKRIETTGKMADLANNALNQAGDGDGNVIRPGDDVTINKTDEPKPTTKPGELP